ncbi:outer membrane beta-barrel protein [Pedobacter ghigonis]|uniref:outer membrane beta-barrel protein n=1 Tax=Pedobacter ghigonis TaxID=2730403 RepID=UPI00158E7583|nr:outer membrane beta-barrel protein [Pedobacter ghigonis]
MINKKTFFLLLFSAITFSLKAQKGNNGLQLSVQGAIPTGKLANVVNIGFGTALKGLYGFGKTPQHLTLEAGYNRFEVKNIPATSDAYYSSIPLYVGYHARLGRIILEGQAGTAFNHVEGSGSSGKVSSNQTAFGWALGAGYVYNGFELGVRYQNSEADTDTYVIRFLGIRLAYNFTL